jgi:hypothetical protein
VTGPGCSLRCSGSATGAGESRTDARIDPRLSRHQEASHLGLHQFSIVSPQSNVPGYPAAPRPPLSIASMSAQTLPERSHPCNDGKGTWHRPRLIDNPQKPYRPVKHSSRHPSHRRPILSALPGLRSGLRAAPACNLKNRARRHIGDGVPGRSVYTSRTSGTRCRSRRRCAAGSSTGSAIGLPSGG